MFKNWIEIDFSKQQQTALDMLRDFMILKSIIVTEHDDFFFGDAIFNDLLDHAMFRFKIKSNCKPRGFRL